MRLFRKILLWIGVVLGLLALTLCGSAYYVLSPAGATYLVNKYGGAFFDGDLSFGKVYITVRDYPEVGIVITDGVVYTAPYDKPNPSAADTLLAFRELAFSVNAARAIKGDVFLKGIRAESPDARLSVDEQGRANWEIYTPDASADTVAGYTFGFDRVDIKNGKLSYLSAADSILCDFGIGHLKFDRVSDTIYFADVSAVATVRSGSQVIADNAAVVLRGAVGMGRDYMSYRLDSMAVDFNDIPVTFDGMISLAEESIDADMAISVPPVAAAALLSQVPESAVPELSKLSTDLNLQIDARLKGTYSFGGNILPAVELDIKSSAGQLRYADIAIPADHIEFDASAYFNPEDPARTGIVIRNMDIRSAGVTGQGHAEVWDALGNPALDVCVKGNFNFTNIAAMLPLPEGIDLGGNVDFDVDLRGRMSELNMKNPGAMYISAAVWMDRFLVASGIDSMMLYADKSEFTLELNNNRRLKDERMDGNTPVIIFAANADTVSLAIKDKYLLRASGVDITARHDARSLLSREKDKVYPLYGSGQIGILEFRGADSTRFDAEDAFTRFSVMPKDEDPSIPVLDFAIGAYRISMRDRINFCRLNGTDIRLRAELIRQGEEFDQRREQVLDSLQTIFPHIARDSLFSFMRERRRFVTVKEDFANYDIDMTAPENIGALLRRWNATGSISAISGRVITPYLPLENSINSIDITFTTDEITLNQTNLRAGESDMNLTGRIYNLRRVLAGRGNLMADLDVHSYTLDFNEIIRAVNASYDFVNRGSGIKEELLEAGDVMEREQIITAAANIEEASDLLVIPSNIEMNIDLKVDSGRYAGIVFESMAGNLMARERCLQINDLDAVTDAGEFLFNALYATRSKEDISIGFDLEIRDIEIEKFIDAVPSADSLFPMMRSFEGLLNCQVAATAKLDTMMNIVLPTLNAACRLNGSNLVLLDGETFTEIAKKLKFRNRERNYIDHISVEMLVRDSRIEMFPFVLEIDRYRTAISGIHNLDMTFDYHISVLRSPIPMRFGLNIRGSLEKLKYGIGRARYKNENVPSYVEIVDEARLNLRSTIKDIFNRGVQAAVISEMRITPDIEFPVEMPDGEELSAADSMMLLSAGILTDSIPTAQELRTLIRESRRSESISIMEEAGVRPDTLPGPMSKREIRRALRDAKKEED